MLERFFDESGGMQLVLHAPFGSRINKAWGLALRKRFCRQFNFELQAAATEDAVLLSLGPQHSFPLADVFRYLHPNTTRDVLVQAFLDAPVFQTRWRWNTTISLAVPRNRGGRKVAAAASADAGRRPDGGGLSRRGGVPGEHSRRPRDPRSSARQLRQSATACRRPWISTGSRACSTRIHRGELTLVARDTPEPSFFAHEILNAQAIRVSRRCAARGAAGARGADAACAASRRPADDLGALDRRGDRARADEARPRSARRRRTARRAADGRRISPRRDRRRGPDGACSTELRREAGARGMATGRGHDRQDRCRGGAAARAARDASRCGLDPPVTAPASRASRAWTRADALVEMLRGRLTIDRTDHRHGSRRVAAACRSGRRRRRCSPSKRTASSCAAASLRR